MSKIFLSFLVFVLFISSNNQQNCNCNNLKEGKFESYEGVKKVGFLYRKGNFQLEKDFKSDQYSIAKIKSDNCLFIMNSYEVKNSIDTITWSINYKKSDKNRYSFIVKPFYLDTNYSMEGYVIKVSNKIEDDEVLKILEKLNSKTN